MRASLNEYLAGQPFELENRPGSGVWETYIYSVDTEMKGSFGIGGVVGYRLHRFVSAEIEGEWLLAFEGDVGLTGPRKVLPQGQSLLPEIATTEFEIAAFSANLRAHLLTGLWQPYLLVGGGMMTVKGEVRETGRMYETDVVDDDEVPKYPDWAGIGYSRRPDDARAMSSRSACGETGRPRKSSITRFDARSRPKR